MTQSRPRRPSPALVVAVLALVMAMAGTGYAAIALPAKSVGTAQLKPKAVTGAKIKAQTITGGKIKLSTLGKVPKAALADSLTAPTLHVVGAAGEPGFNSSFTSATGGGPLQFNPVSFYKDAAGVVHLEGVIEAAAIGVAFVLPPGFRPASGRVVVFPANEANVFGSNVSLEGKDISGAVFVGSGGTFLAGISFRAES